MARGKFGLEFGEVRPPVLHDHHFPVDDGLTGNIQRAGDQRKTFGPVETVAGVDPLPSTVQVNLNAISVELDLMQPLVAFWRGCFECRELGFDESEHRRFLGGRFSFTRTFNHTKLNTAERQRP
jgi:hypothetical protein